MKVLAIALDYDGTIAQSNRLDNDVRRAIAQLRARDLVVLLVTGRRLEDLKQVAGDLHFVDAVIVENGAVIAFPESGYERVLGQPPPAALLEDLRREGVAYAVGQCVIDADAAAAPVILASIEKLQLPLSLIFNRSRVMVLPQSISKATGLLEVLAILRLSPHNTIGIGDAENDHELLRVCELGVAVAWGSDALKKVADFVLPGDGPSSVAKYLITLLQRSEIPSPAVTTRSLLLGHRDDGQPLALAVRGRNVLVAGDSKSGKSWVAGLLCEQLILYGYSLFILDPEGDYTSLEALPGVMVFGGMDPLPRPRDLIRALRHADVSVVVDLSHTPYEQKREYARAVLISAATLRAYTGLPHRIIVDEAHYFLSDPKVCEQLDIESGGYTLVTYRASQLDSKVLGTAEAIVVTCESDPQEVGYLRALCSNCDCGLDEKQWQNLLGSLEIGNAVALPLTAEAKGDIARIRLAPRLTPHARHFGKYIDIPVPESSAFVFWRDGSATDSKARTMREFVAIIEQWPDSALRAHMSRHDFSRWIARVLGDYPLSQTLGSLEIDQTSPKASIDARALTETIRARCQLLDPKTEANAPLGRPDSYTQSPTTVIP
jgi:hydroxymethylpyrimidine pyrophosphatase-like HAD family hydrolase